MFLYPETNINKWILMTCSVENAVNFKNEK